MAQPDDRRDAKYLEAWLHCHVNSLWHPKRWLLLLMAYETFPLYVVVSSMPKSVRSTMHLVHACLTSHIACFQCSLLRPCVSTFHSLQYLTCVLAAWTYSLKNKGDQFFRDHLEGNAIVLMPLSCFDTIFNESRVLTQRSGPCSTLTSPLSKVKHACT